MSRNLLVLNPMFFSILLIPGCTPTQTPDQLHTQLSAIRQKTPASVPTVLALQDFTPVPYDHDGDETPFGISTYTDAEPDRRPAQRGPKQTLEEHALSTIRLVGTMTRNGKSEALIQVNGVVHRARPGDYLGQNFGVIRLVDESQIELEELVRSGNDEWEIRMVTMTLQESG